MIRRPKTQKETVLGMLQERGEAGIHSFEFMALQLPRVAARVHELRAEGYEITSEHEVLNGTAEGCRYTLVGVGAGTGPGAAFSHSSPPDPGVGTSASVDSSETPFELPPDRPRSAFTDSEAA